MDTATHANCPPLPPLETAILTILADQEMHGGAVMLALRTAYPAAVYASPGHVYCTLYHMVAASPLTESDLRPAPDAGHELRRYYTATAQGRMQVQETHGPPHQTKETA